MDETRYWCPAAAHEGPHLQAVNPQIHHAIVIAGDTGWD